MTRLLFERKPARFAAARVAGAMLPGRGAAVGPLSLTGDGVDLPGPDWVHLRPRLSGICGSDLALIDGTAAPYFDPLVSYPFTPGHEVVADVVGHDRRVALIPVLHCATRGISPVCHWCADGIINRCERTAFGHLGAGLQTGFCEHTGGGWGTQMVAHPSQLFDVPADFSDEAAVMLEPTACAVHAAQRFQGDDTVILGAGTLGLLTLAAITARRSPDHRGRIVMTARYAEQRRLAKELGADTVCAPDELSRVVRSASGSLMVGDQLTGGFAHVVDCVGTSDTLQQALQVAAPGGEVQVVGMPGNVHLELTSLWHRETALRGCYAYTRDDFATAVDVIRRFDLGRLVSATYPLHEYTDAIAHAASAGRRGAVRVAFDLRERTN